MERSFEGERLDVAALAKVMDKGSSLSITSVRKADLGRLEGLDALPLSTLLLRGLFATDLNIVPLPPGLVELSIWHSNKFKSLAGIQAAPNLQSLELRGNGLLEDATQLADLAHLRSLSITGDPPSLQKVQTLDFLEGLKINQLTLSAVDGGALDLGPVARLKHLEALHLHGPNFAPQELAKVAAAHPWFLDQLMDLPDCSLPGMRCKKCGGKQKELFLKGKKGLWCPVCSADGLEKALSDFRNMVEAAKP